MQRNISCKGLIEYSSQDLVRKVARNILTEFFTRHLPYQDNSFAVEWKPLGWSSVNKSGPRKWDLCSLNIPWKCWLVFPDHDKFSSHSIFLIHKYISEPLFLTPANLFLSVSLNVEPHKTSSFYRKIRKTDLNFALFFPLSTVNVFIIF
jgi:hypothetical protein